MSTLLICVVIILILTILQFGVFILVLWRNRTKPVLRLWCLAALSLLLATLAGFILLFLEDKVAVPILLVLFNAVGNIYQAVYQNSFLEQRCSWPIGATIICFVAQALLCAPLATSLHHSQKQPPDEPWHCIIVILFILGYASTGLLYLYLFERRASWVTERYNTDNQLIGGIIFCGIIIIAALISSILQDLGVVDDIRSLLIRTFAIHMHVLYQNYQSLYRPVQELWGLAKVRTGQGDQQFTLSSRTGSNADLV